jgi:hypothetical protein
MAGIGTATFVVLSAVQGIGTAVYLFLMGRLFNRLEAHHRSVYESMGSPSLVRNNNFRNNMLVLRWLWRKEYLNLPDLETVRRASRVRALLLILSVNFAILLVLFFVTSAAYSSQAV